MLTKLSKNYILAAVIGVLSTFPSIMPTVLSVIKKPNYETYKKANLEQMIYQLPIFYGILHIILYFIIGNYFPEKLRNYLTLGIIIGLIYPTLGTISGHANLYNMGSTSKLYITAMVLYVFMYTIIFSFIDRNIC